MADNVSITAGSGTTIAADDIGAGVLVQRVKAVLGADGIGVDPSAGSGVNGTGVQRVTIATDDVALALLHSDLTAGNAQLPTTLGQGTTAQSLKVALPSDQASSTTVTITRPANVTAYTALDVLGGALTIATGLTSGQNAIITGVDLLPEITAVPAGMTSFRLYLYDATPVSAIADNGAWTFTSTDWPNFLGYVEVGTPVDLGAGLYCQTENINHQIKLNAATNIFGYLVTTAGFTPAANSEVYLLRVKFLGC